MLSTDFYAYSTFIRKFLHLCFIIQSTFPETDPSGHTKGAYFYISSDSLVLFGGNILDNPESIV